MAVSNEFQARSLNNALQRLVFSNVINDEQRDALEEYYKNDPRSYDEISKEIYKLENHEDKLLEELLKKAAPAKVGIELNNTETKDKKVELSLDDISDITRGNKSYIKIHYPYPYDEVKVIKNTTGKSAEELFKSAADAQAIMSADGRKNATSVFEQLFEESTKVEMEQASELTTVEKLDKLTRNDLEILKGTIVTMVENMQMPDEDKERLLQQPIEDILKTLNKKIWISVSTNNNPVTLENNVVAICDENTNENDIVYSLNINEEHKYKLESFNDSSRSIASKSTTNYDESDAKSAKRNDLEVITKGYAYTKKPNYNKKKADSAAFISIVSLLIIGSVILGIVSASLIKLYIK